MYVHVCVRAHVCRMCVGFSPFSVCPSVHLFVCLSVFVLPLRGSEPERFLVKVNADFNSLCARVRDSDFADVCMYVLP